MVAAALLLTGCATDRVPPEPQIRTVEVKVPVVVPCIERVPETPAGLGPLPDDMSAALSLALAKLAEFFGYAKEADGKMRACAGVR